MIPEPRGRENQRGEVDNGQKSITAAIKQLKVPSLAHVYQQRYLEEHREFN